MLFDVFPGEATEDDTFCVNSLCVNFPLIADAGELADFKNDKVRFTLALADVVEATADLK